MSAPLPRSDSRPDRRLDLSAPPCLADPVERLARTKPPAGLQRAVTELVAEDNQRLRAQVLGDAYRRLDPREIARHVKTAAALAVRGERAGLRLLFGFLEVKRPGVEVMRQVEPLTSVERVSLKILNGSWTEPDDAGIDRAGELITATVRGASRMGVLGRGGLARNGRPDIVSSVLRPLREWFGHAGLVLDSGRKLPPAIMNLVTDIARLEVEMLERRVSRMASRVDPHDDRTIRRLMPVASFFDQEIDHLRTVVAQLETYRPFRDRLLTMERVLSKSEVDAIAACLAADPDGAPAGRILSAMRNEPLLDREFAWFVAVTHRLAALRSGELGTAPPDVLSIMLAVIDHADREDGLDIVMEPAVAAAIRPAIEETGIAIPLPHGYHVPFRQDRAADWIEADGLPRLDSGSDGNGPKDRRTIRDLVQAQIGNEPFILGILDNTRVTNYPGVVPLIVMQCRSTRVLSKIASTRRLQTGPSNKDVPRLLLLSPVRIPVNTLKPLIHVRFISRVDLERLARSGTELRPEVRKEIETYIALLRK